VTENDWVILIQDNIITSLHGGARNIELGQLRDESIVEFIGFCVIIFSNLAIVNFDAFVWLKTRFPRIPRRLPREGR
jgi:hypothetical protein